MWTVLGRHVSALIEVQNFTSDLHRVIARIKTADPADAAAALQRSLPKIFPACSVWAYGPHSRDDDAAWHFEYSWRTSTRDDCTASLPEATGRCSATPCDWRIYCVFPSRQYRLFSCLQETEPGPICSWP